MHGAELVGEVRERNISSSQAMEILKVHNGGKETHRNLEETTALLEPECLRISVVGKYVMQYKF